LPSSVSRLYSIQEGSAADRRAVEEALPDLLRLPDDLRGLAITAWVTSWKASSWDELRDMPVRGREPLYSLVEHVHDVVRCCFALAEVAASEWECPVDQNVLTSVALLHDVDKPLLLCVEGGQVQATPAARIYPHGVLGTLILHDLGFSDEIKSIVATHGDESPFHGSSVEAWILHYADFFAADLTLRPLPGRALYQRRASK
jgi:putative nucleotidyltransferase with HDIG domain